MAHVVWGCNARVAGLGLWLGRMFLYVKGVQKNLQKDEKQAFCPCLRTAAPGPVWLERWLTPASLCFLRSWPEASSWEWPCGSGMTHRRRISSTCSWGTSRPPTPSTSVSSTGGCWCGCVGVMPQRGLQRAQKQGGRLWVSSKVGLKIPPAPLLLPKTSPAVLVKACVKCQLWPKHRIQSHGS